VPVDGFWSVSLYNADGYFEKNAANAYAFNNITAKKDSDGSRPSRGCYDEVHLCDQVRR
jgi:hypothetical protein